METILIVVVIGLLFGLLGGTRTGRKRIAGVIADDLTFGDHAEHVHHDWSHHDVHVHDGIGFDGGGHH